MSSQKQQPERVAQLKSEFLQAAEALFHPSNHSGKSIVNFFQRSAKQLNVSGLDPKEVLIQAYIETIQYIEKKQEPINSPIGWLRKVGYRILIDELKKEKRERLVLEKLQKENDWYVSQGGYDSSIFIQEDKALNPIWNVLSKLPEKDRRLVELRYLKGLQYKDIQSIFSQEYGDYVKLPALRKRESRALKRLRDTMEDQ